MGINNHEAAAQACTNYDNALYELRQKYPTDLPTGVGQPYTNASINEANKGIRTVLAARAWTERRNELLALKADQEASRKTYRLELERKLYGLSGTPTPEQHRYFREARREVAAAEGDRQELSALYRDAQVTGDTTLMRAVVREASAHQYTELLSDHYAQHPNDREHVENLSALDAVDKPGETDDMIYDLESLPDELTGSNKVAAQMTHDVALTPEGIEQIANTEGF